MGVPASEMKRTCEEHVARFERHDRRDVLKELGNVEDHVTRVAILFRLAVDLEPEVDVARVGNLVLADKRAG